MNDPVLRVLLSRQSLSDEGYSKGLMLSGAAHATTFLALLILTILTPRAPIIRVVEGVAIPLPKGGGLPSAPQPAEAPSEPAEAEKTAPKEPAPVQLIKPEAAIPKKGLAPEDLKRSVRDKKKMESREIAQEKVSKSPTAPSAAAPTPGPSNAATGLDFTATNPGVFDGTTGPTGALGFYLAAAKNRIWAAWARQVTPNFAGNVLVAFTIHRDGSVDEVEVIQSSGSPAIDRLAERVLMSTQLGPLPNSYEKETLVVHANFKPLT